MKGERPGLQYEAREWWCRLTLRGLAVSFAIVGTLFLVLPDATIRAMNTVGRLLGNFTAAPPSALRFWLSLATGYMVLVTGLAYLAQRDLRGRRNLLVLLALGKATSSLTCLAFYLSSVDAFIYLANFLVDGAIALVTTGIWLVIPPLGPPVAAGVAPNRAPGDRDVPAVFHAMVEAMVPAGGRFDEGARDAALAKDIEAFVGPLLSRVLRIGVWLLEFSPFFLPPLYGRRFSRLALDERIRLLEAWEQSRLVPRRQAIHALKLLVMTQFYSRPEIEARVGYVNPLVRVPRLQETS